MIKLSNYHRRKMIDKYTEEQYATYLLLLGYSADQVREIAYYNYLWNNEEYISKSSLIHIMVNKIKNKELEIPENIEELRDTSRKRYITFWRNPNMRAPEQ